MLGGGHVRRRSIRSLVEASPCVRIEKRKHSAAIQGIQIYKGEDDHYDSPNKARIVEKPSIASTSSYQFGGERMIDAQRGVLERRSLEDNCLSADGEEMASACEYFLPRFRLNTLLKLLSRLCCACLYQTWADYTLTFEYLYL
jgi:serine/arginine repetitive matrix protein 2